MHQVEAKTYGVLAFGIGLTLRDGDRQYFYQQLDKLFAYMREFEDKTAGEQLTLF